MLYVHWKATSISLVREHPTAESLPDFPSVLTYSTMIALNMWLYLYIEVHQIRYNYNHRMDVSDDEFMRFWYNVWRGQTRWITTRGMPHDDDNDYDFDDFDTDISSNFVHNSIDFYPSSYNIPLASTIYGRLIPMQGGVEDASHDFEIQLSTEKSEPLLECPICYDYSVDVEQKVVLNCGHALCASCFQSYMGSKRVVETFSCCMCRATIQSVVVFCSIVKTKFDAYLTTRNSASSHGNRHDDGEEIIDLIDSVEFDMNLFV
jgi:hypothetical protein